MSIANEVNSINFQRLPSGIVCKAPRPVEALAGSGLRLGAWVQPIMCLLMAFSLGTRINPETPFLDVISVIDLTVLVAMGYTAANTVALAICKAKEKLNLAGRG